MGPSLQTCGERRRVWDGKGRGRAPSSPGAFEPEPLASEPVRKLYLLPFFRAQKGYLGEGVGAGPALPALENRAARPS